MLSTQSPAPTPAWAALPPGVSCKKEGEEELMIEVARIPTFTLQQNLEQQHLTKLSLNSLVAE